MNLLRCEKCGQQDTAEHTMEVCLQLRLTRMTEDRDSWKEAWFDQRDATGRIALSEYDRGRR